MCWDVLLSWHFWQTVFTTANMLLINECVCIFALFQCETQLKFIICDVNADTALSSHPGPVIISACTKDVLSYQLAKWNSQPGMTSTHTMHNGILTATSCTIFSIWKLKVKSPLNGTHAISMRLNREQPGTVPKSLASQICFPTCSLSSFRRDIYKRRHTKPAQRRSALY